MAKVPMSDMLLILLVVGMLALALPLVDMATDPYEFFTRWT